MLDSSRDLGDYEWVGQVRARWQGLAPAAVNLEPLPEDSPWLRKTHTNGDSDNLEKTYIGIWSNQRAQEGTREGKFGAPRGNGNARR